MNSATIHCDNPLLTTYELGHHICNYGPENVWRLFKAKRKYGEKRDSTIFIYEKKLGEKLHKPKRKETIAEILRSSFRHLEKYRHPKIVQVTSPLEESPTTIAFNTEPLLGTLSHLILNSYPFSELELKHGLLNIVEALGYMHYNLQFVHRNVNPNVVLVNVRGVWKLGGMEFVEKSINETTTPWTSRLPKLAQPDLDYIAPEIQFNSTYSVLSDMFSLGLLIGFIYNRANLINANHSTATYVRIVNEELPNLIKTLTPIIPVGLQSSFKNLLSVDPTLRPTSQQLQLSTYFNDPLVINLQYLDLVRDTGQKTEFYRGPLVDVMKIVEKKVLLQNIWPVLKQDLGSPELLASVLVPVFELIKQIDQHEFNTVLPHLVPVWTNPKRTVQATVVLLENLHLLLPRVDDQLRDELTGLLYASYDATVVQVQNATLISTRNCANYLPPTSNLLPKLKQIYLSNSQDVKILVNLLKAIESNIGKLERSDVINELIPLLLEIKLEKDVEIVELVVAIYSRLITTNRQSISHNLLATRVLPSLLPQTVNPNLNLELFELLVTLVQEMFALIEKNTRNKLKLDSMGTRRGSRLQVLEDTGRRLSSSEDGLQGNRCDSPTARKDSFLRVQPPGFRRLSDNTLLPTIKLTTTADELPTRRHSSTPPDRRGSSNLQPIIKQTSVSAGAVNASSSSLTGITGVITQQTQRRASMLNNGIQLIGNLGNLFNKK